MAYADRTDFARYGLSAQLLSQIDAAKQDAALEGASSTLDDHLRERFALPLAAWSVSLRKRTCHIAAYDLLVSEGLYNVDSSDKEIGRRAEAAMRWVETCQWGQLCPAGIVDATPDDDSENGMTVSVSNPPRGWGRR